MSNFFVAGSELITWDLTALGPHGESPFRLEIRHSAGTIVEHFHTVASALAREDQLEALLTAARGARFTDEVRHFPETGRAAGGDKQPAGPTILVIDDDSTVTETFATALCREGFNVLTAVNAETGLREATTHHADAIILDLRMPLINGLGFLYRLRMSNEHRHTPVAIVTGSVVDDQVMSELNDLGAELRFKPLWLEDVVKLAHDLVARPS